MGRIRKSNKQAPQHPGRGGEEINKDEKHPVGGLECQTPESFHFMWAKGKLIGTKGDSSAEGQGGLPREKEKKEFSLNKSVVGEADPMGGGGGLGSS